MLDFRYEIQHWPEKPVKIDICGNTLKLRRGWKRDDTRLKTKILTDAELTRFSNILNEAEFWSWGSMYDDPTTLDGCCWEIKATENDKMIKTGGCNHFPESWNQVDEAIMELAETDHRYKEEEDLINKELQRLLSAYKDEFGSTPYPAETLIEQLRHALHTGEAIKSTSIPKAR